MTDHGKNVRHVGPDGGVVSFVEQGIRVFAVPLLNNHGRASVAYVEAPDLIGQFPTDWTRYTKGAAFDGVPDDIAASLVKVPGIASEWMEALLNEFGAVSIMGLMNTENDDVVIENDTSFKTSMWREAYGNVSSLRDAGRITWN